MSNVDISKEAVERLAVCIGQTCACALGPNAEQPVAATLRVQAARIAELERQVEKEREENRWAYVNAALEDSTTQARNDALREAADAVAVWHPNPDGNPTKLADSEASLTILALIKEPTT